MSAYIEQDSQFLTRRGLVVGAILLLHLLILWALVTGLASRAIEAIAPPIQTTIDTEVKKEEAPPPPPPPTFERPPVEIPPSDTVIELPQAQVATTAISATTQHTVAAPVAHTGSRTPPKVGKNFPNSEDYYPAASKRLSEEGAPTVHVCVAATGKLSAAPTVLQSSGSARLDEGAVNLAKAGRYVAATEDGKPVDGCFDFRVKFQLTK